MRCPICSKPVQEPSGEQISPFPFCSERCKLIDLGRWLDGAKTYRLHVPPSVPAKQWWSVALYDLETRCFMDTKYDKVELGSRSDIAKNADGSVDFVFAPEPPKGSPESNWIPTVPGRAWFTYFRLYAPLQPYFDASWKLPDIEAA